MEQDLSDKIILKYQRRGHESSINLFFKQWHALKYCEENHESLLVFSIEVGTGGQRQYLVSNIEDFWSMYQDKSLKNMYEVIPTFKKSKLYFDVEFSKTLNPHKDGHFMVRRLISLVKEKLKNDYQVTVEDNEFLILESSNSSKFSVHLILISSVIFASSFECGVFVKELLKQLTKEDETCFQIQNCNATGRSKDYKSFVDAVVYGKNTNFRIYLSSKKKEFRPLVLSPLDVSSTNIKNLSQDCFHNEVLKRSLITYCPCNKQTNKLVIKEPALAQENTRSKIKSPAVRNLSIDVPKESTAVEETISKIVFPGRIRHVAVLDETICYNITQRTFCEIKNGNHTSMTQVYFVYCPAKRVLMQKCFSYKCRRLPPIHITVD